MARFTLALLCFANFVFAANEWVAAGTNDCKSDLLLYEI